MDSILPTENIKNNRETIKYLWLEDKAVDMLLDLDKILADNVKKEDLKETLQSPFCDGEKKWIGKLEVKYKNNDKELVENTLYFEFNDYILEFEFVERARKTIFYYLRHIHELDISVKNKRKFKYFLFFVL